MRSFTISMYLSSFSSLLLVVKPARNVHHLSLSSHTKVSCHTKLNMFSPYSQLLHEYVDDPKGRGTVGIIVSRLVTLAPLRDIRIASQCAYEKWDTNSTISTLHQMDSSWAIFIPELVVSSAWKQWRFAKSMGS